MKNLILILLVTLIGCKKNDPTPTNTITLTFSSNTDNTKWGGTITDDNGKTLKIYAVKIQPSFNDNIEVESGHSIKFNIIGLQVRDTSAFVKVNAQYTYHNVSYSLNFAGTQWVNNIYNKDTIFINDKVTLN